MSLRNSRGGRHGRTAAGAAAAIGIAAVLSHGACIFLPASAKAVSALKNRTAHPLAADFDSSVTLDALLQPGEDSGRWSIARAATIEGYVVRVHQAGIEAANGFSLTRRDTHIEIASRLGASPRERVIVEVTPAWRDWAKQRGLDWSADTLQRALVGRRCRFEGWLLFDRAHADESENTSPGRPGNWRATAWEIHPVTAITIVDHELVDARSLEKR
jgi:hypothetical protein